MAKATAKKNSAFMKPVQPSEHLAKIVGTAPLPRTEVTKKIWAHIKKHKLQNPKNKREILPMINYSLSLARKRWTCFR